MTFTRRSIILGLIPARGGSKGIPGKNLRPLAGKSLLERTIDCAKTAGGIDRIVVSTDAPAIAHAAENAGVPVPWLRPKELAQDASPTIDAVLHALERLEQDGFFPDAVLLLQPTSPFRSPATVRRALEVYSTSGGESVLSVTPAREHPYHHYRLSPDGSMAPFIPYEEHSPHNARRQDLEPVYKLDGSIYLASVELLKKERTLFSPRPRTVITGPEESLDLDTPLDWEIAECLAARRTK
jgi:CMP-N,N'-diacetyllegionaminic acid synthase